MANTEHFASQASQSSEPLQAVAESPMTVPEPAANEIMSPHGTGEKFNIVTPEDIEKVRVRCSYLGAIPLAEASILVRLEAKGQAVAAEKAEQSTPKPKTDKDHKPPEIVKESPKEKPLQKAPVLSAEQPVRLALATPEQVEVTTERVPIVEPHIKSSPKTILEQAKVSELADRIARNRSNFLHTEALANPATIDVDPQASLDIVTPQHTKLAVPPHHAEPKVSVMPIERIRQTPDRFVSVLSDQLESLEVSMSVTGLMLPVAEMFSPVEPDDEQYKREASVSLSSISILEGLIYDGANELADQPELTEIPLLGGELPPLLAAAAERPTAMPMSHENVVAEVASALETILPQPVHAKLETYLESAEPEQAARVEDLRGLIIETISQLQELLTSERAEPQKVELLEQLIEDQYRELLQELDMAVDEVSFKRFMAQMTEFIVQIPVEQERRAGLDEGTHEHKQNFGAIVQDLSQTLTQKLQHMKLAKFIVQASTTSAAI